MIVAVVFSAAVNANFSSAVAFAAVSSASAFASDFAFAAASATDSATDFSSFVVFLSCLPLELSCVGHGVRLPLPLLSPLFCLCISCVDLGVFVLYIKHVVCFHCCFLLD